MSLGWIALTFSCTLAAAAFQAGAASFPDSLYLYHTFQLSVRLRELRREDSLAGGVGLSLPRAGLGKQVGLG